MAAVAVLLMASTAVLSGAATSYGAVADPVPVRDDPAAEESAPTSYGAWFGWSRRRDRAERVDFLVQRPGRPPVRLNAPGTSSPGGAITGRRAFYLQQRGSKGRLQVYRYDLRTGRRSPMPASVNDARYRGQRIRITGGLSASGPWLAYNASVPDEFYGGLDLLVLHNRVTGRRKIAAEVATDYYYLGSGQLNGDWLTHTAAYSYEVTRSEVVRVNIRTGRGEEIEADGGDDVGVVFDPAVSADGTLYYWQFQRDPATGAAEPGGVDLVRRSPAGQTEVVVTADSPGATFVKDRPDGSKVVLYSSDGDIYRLVDRPEPAGGS